MFIRIAVFVALGAACSNSDDLRATHAAIAVSDTVDLGHGYVGETLEGKIAVSSTGDGVLRIVGVETDEPSLVAGWGEVIKVAAGATIEVPIRWTPAAPQTLDATVLVLSDAELEPVQEVRVVGSVAAVPLCNERLCQNGVFNRATEQCDYSVREGHCDDGNACTLNDHCLAGQCTGDYRECSDGLACTKDLCDPQTGCVFPTDPDACVDDGEFCTAELCNAGGECETTTVADWTGCAPPTCFTTSACFEGVCTQWTIDLPGVCHDGELDFGTGYVGNTSRTSLRIEATMQPLRLTRIATSHPDLWVDDHAVGTTLEVTDSLEIRVEWRPSREGTLQGDVLVETTECESWMIAVHGEALPTPVCDDGDPCTHDWFDPARGRCTRVPNNATGCPTARLSAGFWNTCAVSEVGGLKCWGSDDQGQLGDGGTNQSQSTPVDVVGLSSGVLAVAAGERHACALLDTSGLKCWGENPNGQLGDGGINQSQSTPVDVVGLSSGVLTVAAGGFHNCALLDTGGLKCWGNDHFGQLGDGGANTDQSTPVDVAGLSSGVVAVAAGGNHACALLDTGGLKCWGYDYFGQLGDGGANTDQSTPVDVAGLSSGVLAVAAGGFNTCALLDTNGLKCWGYDWTGQLGDGGANTDQSTPVDVAGLSSGVVAVAAGVQHTCALLDTGGLKCWGYDGFGPRSTPVDVAGLSSGVVAVTAGGYHTCALLDTGGIQCWGSDSAGQLGDGGANTDQYTPVDVVGFP